MMSRVPDEEDLGGETVQMSYASDRPVAHLVRIAGPEMGRSFKLEGDEILIGRSPKCQVQIDESGVSRSHVRIAKGDLGHFVLEDRGSSNGTLINGVRVVEPVTLEDGDKIQVGPAVLRFALIDATEASGPVVRPESVVAPWAIDSWRTKTVAQEIVYEDDVQLQRVLARLARMPPLVTSWEVDALKQQIAEAQDGQRFFLQGGDCAETFAECEPGVITNKLKILIQMSLVLIRTTRLPIVRVGRFAGQFAMQRSNMTEVRNGVVLPRNFGDIVNRPEFSKEARRPDPELLLAGHQYASATLNFIRGLSDSGFSDLRRPEYFDLSFQQNADLPASLKEAYSRVAKEVSEGMQVTSAPLPTAGRIAEPAIS